MKCRECSLSLRCLAGRLGHINFCPECHYIAVEVIMMEREGIGCTKVTGTVRLRCEKRGPDLLKGTPPIAKGQGILVPDPVGTHVIGIAQCSKCDAKDRASRGWNTQPQSYYDAQEMDNDEVS